MMQKMTTHITGWRDCGKSIVVDFLGRAAISTSIEELEDLVERLRKMRNISS
jgi:hypothetical protein